MAKTGRKPNSQSRALTMLTLHESAPWAAQHLSLVVQGKIKSTALRVEACRYVIDQIEGRPTQKLVQSGEIRLVVDWEGNRPVEPAPGRE